MNVQKVLLWMFFGLMIAFVLAFTISYTLDMYTYHNSNAVALLSAGRIILLVVGTAYLWTVRENLGNAVDAFSIILVAVILVGAATGLFNQSDWLSYLRHGFQYACMLVFYLVGRDLSRRNVPKPVFITIFIAILFGYTIATILYAATPGLQSGSYSFQPNLALLPLAYNGSAIMSAISIALIIVGNKRAVFVGASFCIATLVVLALTKRRGRRGLLVRTTAILALTPAIAISTALTLSGLQIPLVGMVANRLSPAPSFVNTDTKAAMTDLVTKPLGDPTPPPYGTGTSTDQNSAKRSAEAPAERTITPERREEIRKGEANVDPLLRLTGARNVELVSVWRLLKSRPLGLLAGAGFGSAFAMEYISPNDYEPVNYVREQADVMPVQIALTSGLPLAVLLTAALLFSLLRMYMHLAALQPMGRTFSLFCLSTTLDIIFGFNATNAVIWVSVGYATMHAPGASLSTSE